MWNGGCTNYGIYTMWIVLFEIVTCATPIEPVILARLRILYIYHTMFVLVML